MCPVIPRWTSSDAESPSPLVAPLGADPPRSALAGGANRSSMNFPCRSTAVICFPGRCCSSAMGSSMKSVFPSVTDRIRRPRTLWRSPRAIVSTSGSSGMRSFAFQNSTDAQVRAFCSRASQSARGFCLISKTRAAVRTSEVFVAPVAAELHLVKAAARIRARLRLTRLPT
jgi:hypothetical protein